MIDYDPKDLGMDRTGARQFFRMYHAADYLKDYRDVEEAVAEYIGCEGEDVNAQRLRSDIAELIKEDLSDDQLVHLIEKVWGCQVYADEPGFSYRSVVRRVDGYLKAI